MNFSGYGWVIFRQSSNESYVIVFSFKYYMDCLYFLAVIPKGISQSGNTHRKYMPIRNKLLYSPYGYLFSATV